MYNTQELERIRERVKRWTGVPASVFGKTWYVDTTNGNDSNGGTDPLDAFATLGAARTASSAGDKIIIARGTYTQLAAAQPLTPKAATQWVAAIVNQLRPSVVITGTAEAVVVDVDVDLLEFEGIEFKADHNDVSQLVRVANAAAVAGLTFRQCRFNGNAKTTVDGISAVHATQAVSGLIVQDCLFDDLDNGIKIGVAGMPGSLIEHNTFLLKDTGGADIGISLADTTAGATGYGYIIRLNDFIGPADAGADAVGIAIAGTENTVGIGMIRNNFFSFCTAAAITIDKLSQSEINNYYGDVATGGTLVDPGT